MKKFLVLLLISILAIFVFAGCDSVIPSEGEGEGEGEPEGVTVEIANSVPIKGIDYVKGGANTITVTFPAPVTGIVQVDLSNCYSTGNSTKFLFPNEDKTVWTGTIDFGCYEEACEPCADPVAGEDCCEAVITIVSGACETDECVVFPVIVDCYPPEVDLQLTFRDCNPCPGDCETSDGVYFEFTSNFTGDICDPGTCCDDDCSGVGSWSFALVDDCNPCILAEDTGCPIEGETNCECLVYPATGTATYDVKFVVKDAVGNEASSTFTIVLDTDEIVSVDGDTAIGIDSIFDFPVSGNCFAEDSEV